MPDEELLLADPLELLELLELLEDDPEDPEDPDDPELDDVDADEAAVEELDSPLLSVVVCDAVSHAEMKKATATSAIRRCNMVMLPVLVRLPHRRRHPGLVRGLPDAPVRHRGIAIEKTLRNAFLTSLKVPEIPRPLKSLQLVTQKTS